LAFIGLRKVIFVHGCFWHQHAKMGCTDARLPKTRSDYWLPKLARNAERDAQHLSALKAEGWRALVIWDCETRDLQKLEKRVLRFLAA
jgi:DNA mismatch endonuclease (patch repair protein)